MYGKAFILIKPDGIELNLVDSIIQKVMDSNINIIKQEEIFLNTLDIMNLWTYTQSDIVSRYLFQDYLLGKRCILMQLESSKPFLYKELAEIKNDFRKKYGHHHFQNVMHTPANIEEYNKDIKVLKGKIKGIIANNTIIGSFNCYVNLDKLNLINLCPKIKMHMNTNYHKLIWKYGKQKSFLIVYKNGINDSYFLVGILCDHLKYSFELSYYLAFSVNYFRRFPIMILENIEYDIAKIRAVLDKYSYKTIILKGSEYLNGKF